MTYDHWKTTEPDPFGPDPEEAYSYGKFDHLILPTMTIRDLLQAYWQWQEDEDFIGYIWPLSFEDYLQ